MFRKTLTLALALLAMGVTGVNAQTYDAAAALESARADIPNWQSYLPDNVFVAHLSIPGTHDTMTGEGWNSDIVSAFGGPSESTTQSATFDTQLNYGVRGFDIRPGMNGSNIMCSHGVTHTKKKLVDAMKQMQDFLTAHPSEFFIIHMFRGSVKASDSDADTFAQRLEAIIGENGTYNDLFVEFNPMLTVGDVRGKIVVILRQELQFVNLPKFGYTSNWSMGYDPNAPTTLRNATDRKVKTWLHVQDISDPYKNEGVDNSTDEVEHFTRLVNDASAQTAPNDVTDKSAYVPYWVINFTSGEGVTSGFINPVTGQAAANTNKKGTDGYKANAVIMNPYAANLIEEKWTNGTAGPLGVFLSDWVLDNGYDGYRIVQDVLENNFHYIDRFIIDDVTAFDHDFNAVDESVESERISVGKYYLRNVATGTFLAEGNEWGTHAITRELGVPIEFIESGNGYQLKSPMGYFRFTNVFIDSKDEDDIDRTWYLGLDNGSYTIFSKYDDSDVLYYLGESNHNIHDVNAYEVTTISDYERWELVTEEELIEEILDATIATPKDATILFPAAEFDPNDERNATWEVTTYKGGLTGNSASVLNIERGPQWRDEDANGDPIPIDPMLRLSNDKVQSGINAGNRSKWDLNKVVENLPNGIYTLTFDAVSSVGLEKFKINGQDISIVVGGNAGDMTVQDLMAKFKTTDYRVTVNLEITDGKITIEASKGSHTSATAFAMDHFRLTYYGPSNVVTAYDNVSVHENEFLTDDFADNHVGIREDGSWGANKIVLEDAVNYSLPIDVTANVFTYQRNVSYTGTDGWHALYLPFEIENWGDIASRVITFSGIDVSTGEDVLLFEDVAEGAALQAHQLYIVQLNDNIEISEINKMVNGRPAEDYSQSYISSLTGTTYTLYGNYETKTDMATSGAYALSKDKFLRAQSDATTLKPFRAYLMATNGSNAAPRLSMAIDNGGTTGIEYIGGDENVIDKEYVDDAYYNLQGIKVDVLTPGLYIHNGKKIYIK